MTEIGFFLISFFALIGVLLYLTYLETEQDLPPVHRGRRH
jgi:hypothetical protein